MNPVPVSVLKEMGADFIIAVSTTPDIGLDKDKEPNIFNITMQTIFIVTHRLLESSLAGANAVIKPQTASIGYFDFRQAEKCLSQGEVAAQKLIPEIKEKLKRASSQKEAAIPHQGRKTASIATDIRVTKERAG